MLVTCSVQHVILNHTYCEKSKNVWGTRVLGTTHRYRSKYVTVVMYKPEKAAHRPPQ
jgi:5'-AMP-activated protein kinase regulatory beta subunit